MILITSFVIIQNTIYIEIKLQYKFLPFIGGESIPSGRGGGRGRGSRGRRRMDGSYGDPNFLYYMNEGGIRSGSTIGPTGSPSRLVSTSSGDA